ncbi:MAG: hypothetical protein R3B45_02830 [Bdellovibrionota bacterium]
MQHNKVKWPRKSAVVISHSPNFHMLLKELLRSYGWKVEDSTSSVKNAISLVEKAHASLIIVDDMVDEPAAGVLRVLLSNPITCATPIFSFLLDSHVGERDAIMHIGGNAVAEKPLTPSKFTPAFEGLIAKWESKPFLALRMATHQYIMLGEEVGHNTIKKLVGIDSVLPMVAQNLSLTYRKRNNIADAEKILLYALKKHPKNLGLMLALGELYLFGAMPKMALRLFTNAQLTYGESMTLLPDLVQSAIFTGNYEEAVYWLLKMKKNHWCEGTVSNFLARMLFAEGREFEAEKHLLGGKHHFRKMKEAWEASAEAPSMLSAS